jgi:hypothetical protein
MRGVTALPVQGGNGLISSLLSLMRCSVAFIVAPECPRLTSHRENLIHIHAAIPCAYRNSESFMKLIHPVAPYDSDERAIQRVASEGFVTFDN